MNTQQKAAAVAVRLQAEGSFRIGTKVPICVHVGDQETIRPRRWRSALVWASVVTAVGVSASFGGAAALYNTDRHATQQATQRRVALTQRAVSAEMRRYIDAIRLVAASAGAQPQLTRDTYLTLTQPLVNANLVGATGAVFVVSASDDQVAAVQAQWRARGAPGLQLHPEGTGREHFFTVFNRALDSALPPPTGVDVAQAAEPAAALAEARRSGAIIVSRPYLLLRDRNLPPEQRQWSCILTAPVLGPADATGHQPFIGWIMTGLRGENFASAVLRDSTDGLGEATLYATGADGHKLRLAGLTRASARSADWHEDVAIPVAQENWTLHVTAPADSGSTLPLWVASGGSVLTLAFAAVTLVLMTARDRARHQVIRATGRLEADIASREIMEAQLRHARDALAASQSYLTGLLDSIDVAVTACDNEGRVTLQNAYAHRLCPPGTLTYLDGTPLTDDQLPLARTLREGSVDGLEVLYHGSGRRPPTMLTQGRTLYSSDGTPIGAVVTAYDITQQRDHERELAGFATIAAHDLKAPLAVIATYAELLADSSTGEAAELLRRIESGVGRMRALIDDLLAYASARDVPLDAVDVDLRQVVADVVTARTDHLELAHDAAAPDIYVGPLPAVHADAGMVRQLVDNLVGNALKYVHPGRPARVDVTAAEENGWVRVDVADRGIGVPAGEREAIFEPFHRAHTEHPYGGTGLGLAICRRIVERHGGQISVTANVGGGSRFYFTLPAAVGSPDFPAAAKARAQVRVPGPIASAA
jgi:signal transduction histidine kinase